MASSTRRTSTVPISNPHGAHNSRSKDEPKKEIWSGLLESVSSGKRVPEKTAFVLGGDSTTQRDFLESLSSQSKPRRPQDRARQRQPPVANSFALGYTYHDVLDADQEDTLARLSLYLLHTPSTAFATLLKPLLTPTSIPNSVIVILLDWAEPWNWLRQLREWIRALREVMLSLDDDCKYALEDCMKTWRENRNKLSQLNTENAPSSTTELPDLPLGPGEWDAPLGLPLIVVAQNADKIERHEKEQSWKDEEFDFILQYLRTVLLKHGAALIYTFPNATQQTNVQLQSLIHSSLGITDFLGRDRAGGVKGTAIKHNVVDRERVLVPMGWDSWGKIRILREGFDAEAVGREWSEDIERPTTASASSESGNAPATTDVDGDEQEKQDAVTMYEDVIRSPDLDNPLAATAKATNGIEVETQGHQEFLSQQLEILERLRIEDEREKASKDVKKSGSATPTTGGAADAARAGAVVEEHIGPVHFNMGGIQVNAEDVVQRLSLGHPLWERNATPAPETPDRADKHTIAGAAGTPGGTPASSTPSAERIASGGDLASKDLKGFFAGLVKPRNRGGDSATNSPHR